MHRYNHGLCKKICMKSIIVICVFSLIICEFLLGERAYALTSPMAYEDEIEECLGLDNLIQKKNESKTNSFSYGVATNSTTYKTFLYDNTNGLATSEVNDIVQTSDGAIWIGSHSGLTRYDGTTFELIDTIPSVINVVDLFVDRYNRIWIGTNDNGVAVLDENKKLILRLNAKLPSESIRSITEDLFGNVYIGTTEGIAVVDRDMKVYTMDEPNISNVYVKQLCRAKNGYVYGITMNSSFFVIRNGEIKSFFKASDLRMGDIRAILPDKNNEGYVYFACEKSEIYYGIPGDKISNMVKYDSTPLTYVNELKYIDDNIWICSDDGVGVLDGKDVIMVNNLPVEKTISHVMNDYQGNIWLSSTKQGLMKIVPCWFENLFETYQLTEDVVNSTCLYKDMLFVGKDLGLTVMSVYGDSITELPLENAMYHSGNVINHTDLITMLKSEKIHSIVKDSNENLWISTYGSYGLIFYDGKNVVCYTKDDGMTSDHIRVVKECKDGSIAVAGAGGLTIIKDNSIVKVYNESSGIKNTEILTVTEGFNGDIILGSDGGGMYIINDGTVKNIDISSGLSSGVVSRIKNDDKRHIYWIITSNSISYMDSEYNITNIDTFSYKNNYDLIEDNNDNMWILSGNGIYVVPIDDLLQNKKRSTTFYSMDNGLNCITTANSYNELTNWGDLYISGNRGVVKVNINNSFKAVKEIKIGVPYIKADDTVIYPNSNGKFNIPASTKKITIFAYVYNYGLVNPEVTYYLKGFDENKTTIDTQNFVPIDYTNLPGGEYNFKLSLVEKTSRYTNELSITIIKPKAFYEMVWFYVLCIVLLVVIVVLIVMTAVRYKTNKYEKRSKEQQTLIREISEAFAKTIDMKDKYTNGHSFRVASYTAMLTKELGYSDDVVEKYRNIALLHDIGKIGISEEVLNKPDKLTREEFELIKSHSMLGSNVLKDISIMPEFATGAGAHHERPDGKGYPNGLKGDEIPRVAQIIAVADTFDAMYSNRTYRKRMNFEKVVSIIKKGRGTQLSADVVDAFVRLVEKGEFKASDDDGGGSLEDINNISEGNKKEK